MVILLLLTEREQRGFRSKQAVRESFFEVTVSTPSCSDNASAPWPGSARASNPEALHRDRETVFIFVFEG